MSWNPRLAWNSLLKSPRIFAARPSSLPMPPMASPTSSTFAMWSMCFTAAGPERSDKMSVGEVTARHYATSEPVRLRWREGTFSGVQTLQDGPHDLWIAPGLVDLQINGYGGIDFQQDNLTLEELLCTTRQLRAAGCATWLLTLITDEWPRMMARLRHLRALRSQSAALQSAIAGWHIEGPFLSAEPGFRGAHNPSAMCDP